MDISNISDTAFWVAQYRADETERPDALFKDPYAAKLAGEKGRLVRDHMDAENQIAWALVMRTYLIDKIIMESISAGTKMIVSLACGLDSRPYRMDLPPEMTWVEIDLPGILDYKSEMMKDEIPRCKLIRIAQDLSQIKKRNELFNRLNEESNHILVISEGLLVYLTPEQAAEFARDLSNCGNFRKWTAEIASPGLIKMMNKKNADKMQNAGISFRFGPEEGPGFFTQYGWTILKVHSVFKTAAKFRRIGFFMRLLALLPESKEKQGSRPWSGVCILNNSNPG